MWNNRSCTVFVVCTLACLRCFIKNKKFELMLTGRAKTYSCSCSQTVSLSPAISSRLLWGYPSLMPSCAGFLNLENWDLNHRNLRSMLKISCAVYPCLFQLISVNSLLKCVSQPKITKKYIKTFILAFKVFQGHWIRWELRASAWLSVSD